jgi:hypothetical protein
MVNGDPLSDRLWSFAFQHPSQRIARIQPILGSGEGYDVRVRLAGPYAGPARLFAAVNGVELGPLSWPEYEERDQLEAVASVPAAVLGVPPQPRRTPGSPSEASDLVPPLAGPSVGRAQLAYVVVWADRASPDLRIVVQRAAGGAALGSENSWFYSGETWHRGVVHAGTGTVRSGLWHVFLATRPVSR